MPTFLADTAAGFDLTSVFDTIGKGLEMVFGLCVKFPLNLFIGASVVGIGISIFRKLKH